MAQCWQNHRLDFPIPISKKNPIYQNNQNRSIAPLTVIVGMNVTWHAMTVLVVLTRDTRFVAGGMSGSASAMSPPGGGVHVERRSTRSHRPCRRLCIREDKGADSSCVRLSQANSHTGSEYMMTLARECCARLAALTHQVCPSVRTCSEVDSVLQCLDCS